MVEEPTFPDGASTVRIVTAEKGLLQVGLVELVPKNADARFVVGSENLKTLRFGDKAGQSDFQAHIEGTLQLPTAPAAGTPLFDIKYNNKLVHTVKSE